MQSSETNVSSSRTELAPGVWIASSGLRLQFSRSGGPGGQNVNKINSKAELWASVSAISGLAESALTRLRSFAGSRLTTGDEIHLRAETERSAEANRDEVFERLRQLILQARIEPKKRRKTRPSRASKMRRLESKRRRGETKSGRRGGGDDW